MLFHDSMLMNGLVSPICFFGVSALWVLGVFSLVNIMTIKHPVNVKKYMQVYNVLQIIVCSYMVWGLFPCMLTQSIFGINSAFDKRGEWFVFVHYLSKYFDWFDTLWIILSKKRSQLSFLHIYHHGTIVAVWGMLLHSGVGSGSVRYGAWINSLVHVVMYSHYLWTSFGLKNPLKKCITTFQIGQFYSCLLHAVLVMILDKTPVQDFAWIQLLYQIAMVYLFTKGMNWVPACVPDFSAKKDEELVSCCSFFSLLEGSEEKEEHMNFTQKQRFLVIRGQAYDITEFEHPGGSLMIDLGVGRDATVMFESAHLRLEHAEKTLNALPKFSVEELEKKGYDFGQKEKWPTPSQSKLYETIRKRVVNEILKPRGMATGSVGARGVPTWHFVTVILFWLFAAAWFMLKPSILSGIMLGCSLAWIGTGVQHTANHGGLSRNTSLNYIMGLLNDAAVGGSSLVWRYHHQVSHHAYCNDLTLDQDTYSSYPIMRLDSNQQWQPHHRFQAIYAPIVFSFLWISMQFQDLSCLLNAQAFLVKFYGTKPTEIVFGVLMKVIHFWWIVVIPYQFHGLNVMLFPWMACFGSGGCLLSLMFIVSHNVDDTKQSSGAGAKDWARQQIETSTSWGGRVGSFMSGGLNLQIEHHLFPCMAHHLYADLQVIIKEECMKQGITYSGYPTFFHNLVDHFKFLWRMGNSPAKSDGQIETKKIK